VPDCRMSATWPVRMRMLLMSVLAVHETLHGVGCLRLRRGKCPNLVAASCYQGTISHPAEILGGSAVRKLSGFVVSHQRV
jgi:hypothetical protein